MPKEGFNKNNIEALVEKYTSNNCDLMFLHLFGLLEEDDEDFKTISSLLRIGEDSENEDLKHFYESYCGFQIMTENQKIDLDSGEKGYLALRGYLNKAKQDSLIKLNIVFQSQKLGENDVQLN
jgi:hypothetical protein